MIPFALALRSQDMPLCSLFLPSTRDPNDDHLTMLALTLLILAATYSFVLADHKICVWKPWKDSPEVR